MNETFDIETVSFIALPILGYLLAMAALRYLRRFRIVQKLQLPLVTLTTLALVLLEYHALGFNPDGFAANLLFLFFYLNLVYLVLRAIEHSILEEMMKKRDLNMPRFFLDIARFLLLVFALAFLLEVYFGIEPSGLLVTSTVLSAIIGLALQDSLANVFSGATLQMERPFKEGDWVNINGREGVVLEMSWRTTKIRTRTNDIIIIPNNAVAQHEILNYSEPERKHMCRMEIGASYDDPPEKVKAALLTLLSHSPRIMVSPKPEIFVVSYADFAINYQLRFWIEDYGALLAIQNDINSKIWYRFKRAGISIPFPIRNVMIEQVEHREQVLAEEEHNRTDAAVAKMEQIDILAPFSHEKLQELAEAAVIEVFAPGEFLVRQGDLHGSFMIVLAGRVEVFAQVHGKRKNIGVFPEGYYFGEVAMLTGEARTASVRAIEQAEVLVIAKRVFAPLLKENPELAVTLSTILQQRTQELQHESDAGPSLKNPRRLRQDADESSTRILSRIQRFFNLS